MSGMLARPARGSRKVSALLKGSACTTGEPGSSRAEASGGSEEQVEEHPSFAAIKATLKDIEPKLEARESWPEEQRSNELQQLAQKAEEENWELDDVVHTLATGGLNAAYNKFLEVWGKEAWQSSSDQELQGRKLHFGIRLLAAFWLSDADHSKRVTTNPDMNCFPLLKRWGLD